MPCAPAPACRRPRVPNEILVRPLAERVGRIRSRLTRRRPVAACPLPRPRPGQLVEDTTVPRIRRSTSLETPGLRSGRVPNRSGSGRSGRSETRSRIEARVVVVREESHETELIHGDATTSARKSRSRASRIGRQPVRRRMKQRRKLHEKVRRENQAERSQRDPMSGRRKTLRRRVHRDHPGEHSEQEDQELMTHLAAERIEAPEAQTISPPRSSARRSSGKKARAPPTALAPFRCERPRDREKKQRQERNRQIAPSARRPARTD